MHHGLLCISIEPGLVGTHHYNMSQQAEGQESPWWRKNLWCPSVIGRAIDHDERSESGRYAGSLFHKEAAR